MKKMHLQVKYNLRDRINFDMMDESMHQLNTEDLLKILGSNLLDLQAKVNSMSNESCRIYLSTYANYDYSNKSIDVNAQIMLDSADAKSEDLFIEEYQVIDNLFDELDNCLSSALLDVYKIDSPVNEKTRLL